MSGREETAAEELPQPSLVPKRAEADVTSGEPHSNQNQGKSAVPFRGRFGEARALSLTCASSSGCVAELLQCLPDADGRGVVGSVGGLADVEGAFE